MNGRRASYIFFFFAVAITVVAEEDDVQPEASGEVSIWDTTVTLTCPFNTKDEPAAVVTWHNDKTQLSKGEGYIIENYNDKNDGLYYCKQESNIHYFFIKAKVCKQCIDLDMSLALIMVFADVLFTLGIVLVVYYCARKKTGTATPQRSKETRHSRPPATAPPPPDPDYQPLNVATRNNDVYSMAHRRQ